MPLFESRSRIIELEIYFERDLLSTRDAVPCRSTSNRCKWGLIRPMRSSCNEGCSDLLGDLQALQFCIYFQRRISRLPGYLEPLKLGYTFNDIYFQQIYFQRDLLSTRDVCLAPGCFFLTRSSLNKYTFTQGSVHTMLSYFQSSHYMGFGCL